MRIRPTVTLVSIAAITGLATACEDPVPSETPPSVSESPSQEDGGDGGDSGGGEDAKPDKEVDSDAGKTLDFGETSPVTYRPGTDKETVLEVTPKSLKKGKISDLDGVKMDAEERETQPYYATVTFKNTGDNELSNPPLLTTIKLRDDRGEDAKYPFTYRDDVPQCANDYPDKLGKDDSTTLCKVFLVEKGEKPSVLTYTSTDYKKEPVFWKIED